MLDAGMSCCPKMCLQHVGSYYLVSPQQLTILFDVLICVPLHPDLSLKYCNSTGTDIPRMWRELNAVLMNVGSGVH